VGLAARFSSDPLNSPSSRATNAFSAGALRVKAGRLDQALQLFEGERAQAVKRQGAGRAQIGQRALDGLPGGVLREVSAEDHLKCRFGRPPVLRAIGCAELVVHTAQALGGSESGRGHVWP
jgi:hypothetical protein